MKKLIQFLICVFLLMGSNAPQALAQTKDDTYQLTKKEFAVELVRLLELEHLLPRAAVASDCVDLLERLGIAPLKGWGDTAEILSDEDYLVIISKAEGKEGVVHERAFQVEEANIQVINRKWQEAYNDKKEWPTLSELLNDKTYFPSGHPRSPYGIKYKDKNHDHRVDPVYPPTQAKLVDWRAIFSKE